jgi:hypothetical protein
MDAFYGQDPNTYVGRQFFFLSESYLNFGPFGIPILMYFWGLLAGIVWRYQAGSLGNPAVALIYALIISFFFLAIAGDFSTLFVGLASQFLCPAVIGLRLCSGRGRPFFISRQRGERPCRAIGLPQIDQGSAI